MVTRLAEQKGIDLLFDALPALLQARDFGFLVLGSGDDRYAAFFDDLARRFQGPGRIPCRATMKPLAHLIEAGSDMFLMPSRYEPCGLNQMYSLRYGTIPIVRKTGGLADSVQHFDPATGSGTGCVFNDYDAPAVRWASTPRSVGMRKPSSWRQLMQNAMAKDFSWSRQISRIRFGCTAACWAAANCCCVALGFRSATRSGGRGAASSSCAISSPADRSQGSAPRRAARAPTAIEDRAAAPAASTRKTLCRRGCRRARTRSMAAASIGPGTRSREVPAYISMMARVVSSGASKTKGLPAASCSHRRADLARFCQASTCR